MLERYRSPIHQPICSSFFTSSVFFRALKCDNQRHDSAGSRRGTGGGTGRRKRGKERFPSALLSSLKASTHYHPIGSLPSPSAALMPPLYPGVLSSPVLCSSADHLWEVEYLKGGGWKRGGGGRFGFDLACSQLPKATLSAFPPDPELGAPPHPLFIEKRSFFFYLATLQHTLPTAPRKGVDFCNFCLQSPLAFI